MRKIFTSGFFLLSLILHAQSDISKFFNHEVVYSSLPWYNVDGGVRQGFVYMDNLDLTATLNFSKLLRNDESLILFLYGLGNHGGKASSLMGDFQVASNIESPKSWRLFEAWIQQNFLQDRVSLLAGLYDLNSEFDVLNPGTIFINSSFGIGAEYAQTGLNGPSIFPVSSMGVRMTSVLADRIKIKMALLDGVPGDPGDMTSNEVKFTNGDGMLLAFESVLFYNNSINLDEVDREFVTRRKKVGREHDIQVHDKLNVGGWYYSASHLTIRDSSQEKGNWGLYVGGQKYWFFSDTADKYLACFARYGIANKDFNRFGSAISGGLVLSGLVKEKDDYLGLAFSSGINSQPYQDAFSPNYITETAIELTYSLQLADWLTIQPDIQYIINPNTQNLKNPLSIAMLIQVSF